MSQAQTKGFDFCVQDKKRKNCLKLSLPPFPPSSSPPSQPSLPPSLPPFLSLPLPHRMSLMKGDSAAVAAAGRKLCGEVARRRHRRLPLPPSLPPSLTRSLPCSLVLVGRPLPQQFHPFQPPSYPLLGIACITGQGTADPVPTGEGDWGVQRRRPAAVRKGSRSSRADGTSQARLAFIMTRR